jgi:alkylated DNA repair protein (DNA oxidative demethylase)
VSLQDLMQRDTRGATADLFGAGATPETETLADGALLLRRFAQDDAALLGALRLLEAAAPFRHMVTRGGYRMSVAMSNCGDAGWVSDRRGYRYDRLDPDSGLPWPPIPDAFLSLAARAAQAAGFARFAPDACLINRYEPGARMALHQDMNERDFTQPIVSVSLGLPATFLFGGAERADRPLRCRLQHGDVVVWGGPARLVFHGIAPLAGGAHPLLGRRRINLTFRKAL